MQVNKLEGLKGKVWMFRANHHLVSNYKIESDQVTIVTDRDFIKTTPEKLPELLKEFLPVEQGAGSALTVQSFMGDFQFSALAGKVQDTITKLQNNEIDIKKAGAINQSVNTLMNMAKVGIQAIKMSQR